MEPLTFNLLGDEETAQQYTGHASHLYQMGLKYGAPNSMVEIAIHGNVATIMAHMDCPYHLMVPQTYQDSPEGYYEVGLIGYSHRKDAIVPSGLYQSSYVGYEGDYQYGMEVHYMTDGIAVHGACIGQGVSVTLYPEVFDATVCVAGAVTEDVMNARHGADGTGQGAPMGFRPTKQYFAAARVVALQGENTFSVVPHKADRTDPAAPAYSALIGYSYLASGTPVTQVNGSNVQVTSYFEMQHRFGYVTDGKGGPSYNAYYLGDDFCDTTYKEWSSCWPVIWNLSNGVSVLLHRYRINDSSKWFGGSFGLKLIRVEGPPIMLYDLSVAPLLTGYSYASTWSFMEADYPDTSSSYGINTYENASPDLFVPHDHMRMTVLMFDFGINSKKAAVVTANGTLVTFSRRLRMHRAPTNQALASQLCCFAVTADGISQLSVLDSYWDWAEYAADSTAAGAVRKNYTGLRAIATNSTTAILFYELQLETGVGTSVFSSQGWFRRVSTNGGVTWGSAEALTFTGTSGLWEWSRPRVVVDGESVAVTRLIAGYLEKTVAGATKTYGDASVLLSDDGGLTWMKSVASAPGINYKAPAGAQFLNGDAGLGTLHNHGSWEEGYEPSPHKHLPNFYGTPTQICRDSTNDAGL